LAKGYEQSEFEQRIDEFSPRYVQILQELTVAGAEWVQSDERSFSTDVSEADLEITEKVYQPIAKEVAEIKVNFQTYFEKIFHYERIIHLPVAALGIDFVHGDSLSLLQEFGFPADKYLAAGIIDGRNVWRADLKETEAKIDVLR